MIEAEGPVRAFFSCCLVKPEQDEPEGEIEESPQWKAKDDSAQDAPDTADGVIHDLVSAHVHGSFRQVFVHSLSARRPRYGGRRQENQTGFGTGELCGRKRDRNMRVLVISHMYPNPVNPMSGIFVHNQNKALVGSGAEVQVVCPIPRFPLYPKWKGYRNLPEKTELDGIPVHYVPTWMFPGGLFFSLYGSLYIRALHGRLRQIRDEFPFDLIHCHTIYPDGYAGAMLKEEFGVPVVSTVHGSDLLLYPKRSRGVFKNTLEALKRCDRVITVSERLRREAFSMHPETDAVTVYNGFDPKRFHPVNQVEARKHLGLSETGKMILFVGNLLPVKGVHFLLQAFKGSGAADLGSRLVLVGDGPLRAALEKQADELGIGGQVDFAGRRPHDEIPVWIAAADVVVLTSLSEGLPSILLETMGSGRPMVATDVGGIAEVLRDGETGLIARPKDTDHIAECIRRILVEDGLAERMGERALLLSRELTWEQNAKNTLECYRQVLERKTL
jgi:teichuronic acid biosynthesis glycosyltransferase TuaC